MADRRQPPGPPLGEPFALDEEIFVEVPTAPAAPGLPIDDAAALEGVPLIAEPLPEMGPEIWQAGVAALVTASDGAEPLVPTPEEWAWEARLLRDEAALAESPTEAGALLVAAGRAAFRAGDAASAEALLDAALEQSPTAPDVLRARARVAEARGDFATAEPFWGRLAAAVESADEGASYAVLHAEWQLARLGTAPPAALESLPAGPARSFAVAEVALLRGAPGDAAAAFAEAGRALGGVVGAVLVEQAARLTETTAERGRAADLRREAAELAGGSAEIGEPGAGLFGRLRDAARADDRRAGPLLAEVARELAPSTALGHAVRRAAANVARRNGEAALAGRLLGEILPVTAAAARDRIDFAAESGTDFDAPSLERLAADLPGPTGAATLAWIESASLLARGALTSAVAVVERGLAASPDAVPLGIVAEQAASAAGDADPGLRGAALDLWLRADPGRRADAALALAEAREVQGGADAGLAARAALQTAVEAAPGSALFWTVAAADARAGRAADAAATLAYGAETWGASALGPALQAAAAAELARVDAAGALGLLDYPGAAGAFGAENRARLAARAGDRAGRAAALAEAAGATADPERRAILAAERALVTDAPSSRRPILAEALDAAPANPLALALALADDGGAPSTTIVSRLGRAGEAAPSPALASLYRFAAAALADGGDPEEALRCASELVDATPGDRLAHLALIRIAGRLDPDRRARALAELPADPGVDPAAGLLIAESLAEAGQSARAGALLRASRAGRFGPDARRALARLGLEGGEAIPPGLLHGAPDETAAVVRAELAETVELAGEGQWPAVIAAVESGPPHEAAAGPTTLHVLALVAESQGLAKEAVRLARAAVRAAGPAAAGAPLPALGRVVEQDGLVNFDASAFELAAARFSAAGEPIAVAAMRADLARLREAVGEPDRAVEAWRAALEADPQYLPAALALRREVARRRDLPAAIDATEAEAACLGVPDHRVRALLLAAALAEEAAAGTAEESAESEQSEQSEQPEEQGARSAAPGAGRGRALRLLREALRIDPSHDAAFEQLRSVLEEEGDAAALAEALEARIAVAKNPFEVTSLRLARAEVLAGKLADRAGARAELDAILAKQPEHPRALARLAELHWDADAWSDAGEVYLRRAVVEREPRTLREIFLRLGHIYSERVPDAKRAIAAYERVRSLEPDNQEALRALSGLYFTEGDPKLALPVTEQAAAGERDPQRQTALRVRLGELLMRAGDLRRAAAELRRAVDAAPRDLAAVTALAQLYERARDLPSRRNHLDHSVGILRRDLQRGEIDSVGLRTLSSLLALREHPFAAASATGLVEALAPGGARRGREVAGRRLTALRRPEVDERASPPDLPPGVRQIMKLVGPLYRPAGADLARQLAALGLARADRIGRGAEPRPVFEAVASELGAGDFDLYVTSVEGQGARPALRVEPGAPPAIVVGAPIVALGTAAQRFVAGRALRLVATGLDVLLARDPEDAAALLVAIIRLFVPEYRHPEVREAMVDAEAADAARLVPRKLRPQIMPFAIESAGPFDVAALHVAARDAANIAGLLAAGDLGAALSVVLTAAGTPPVGGLTLAAVAANPEALALARYAVSDDYDALNRALGDS